MQWLTKALTWLGAVVAGGVFGIAGTITHPSLVIGGVVPIGMLVAAVSSAGLLLAVRLLADDRGAVLAAGLGMLAALYVFSLRGPGGSVIVPQAAEGEPPFGLIWGWVLAIIVLLVVAWPDLRRLREAQAIQAERAARAARAADSEDTAGR